MKKIVLACAVAALTTLATSNVCRADNKGVITLREIEIVGRVQKPIASVDVATLKHTDTLEELRQPFLDRIEEAVQHDPF